MKNITKKVAIVLSLMLGFCLLALGCGKKQVLEPGKNIYKGSGVFNLAEENKDNLSLSVESKGNGEVEKIVIGSKNFTEGFSYDNGVLTLANEQMKKITSGEKNIRIYFGKKNDKDRDVTEKKTVLFVTKVIKNAEDFQSIGENLMGSYILANNIDCSSIKSFKPFGRNSGDAMNPNNKFFHGVFEGNGYTVSNVNINYRDLEDDPYYNRGQVLGVFTNIGTAGIVRNTNFKNIRVDSRTIAGAICGTNEGRIKNCSVKNSYITQDCGFGVTCSVGVLAGINAGGGNIENCYATDSAAINRGGYVLVKAEDGVTDMYLKFVADIKYQLAFCGKTWGLIKSCFALDHGVVQPEYRNEKVVASIEGEYPFTITERLPKASDLKFYDFSRLDNDPNEGGDAFSGVIQDCEMLSNSDLKVASKYFNAGFDTSVWNINDGEYPTLKRIYNI